MAAMDSELKNLFKNNNISEDVAAALRAEPFKITTFKQFANFFSSKAEVTQLFISTSQWKADGAVKSDLTMAWREADTIVEKGLRRTAQGLPEEGMEDPLRVEVHTTLSDTWKGHYKIQLPTSWQTSAPLLGRFHREFQKQVHVLFKINKIRTLENTMSLVPEAKRARLSHDIELRIPQADTACDIDIVAPFGYLTALKVLMYSFSLAGAYLVMEDEEMSLFAPLDPLLQHLATAESYALRHSSGKDRFGEAAVLHKLRMIDEAIRSEWARLTRDSGFSLGKACFTTHAFSASLWLSEPIRNPLNALPANYDPKGSGKKGNGKGSGAASSWETPLWQPPVLNDKGKGKGKKGSGKYQYDLAALDHHTGKAYCRGYNSSNGCVDPRCQRLHQCDVVKPNGQPCNHKFHNRTTHGAGKGQ